jgi:nitrite reductase/ring-hydroxylating ferredoxin subunit
MFATERTGTAGPVDGWVRAGELEELAAVGVRVVSGGRHGIAVVAYRDGDDVRIAAVDNRCPHMGFPLSRGTVCDGILTCHWHHARFELATGGTFDPFADDVAVHAIRLIDGIVWVDPRPAAAGGRDERYAARLEDGLEQNLSLVLVKSVLGLMAEEPAGAVAAEAAPRRILEVGARFGARQRAAGWGPGLTILTAMGNVLDRLGQEERAIGLFHGLSHVADDCAGAPARFQLDPLPTRAIPSERLRGWFRQFVEVRNGDGAERTLLTAIASGIGAAELREMMLAAATDHFFVNGGHTVDFVNKAFELLELIGWEHAPTVLTSLLRGLAGASRSEEQNAWRAPIDLVELARPSLERLRSAVPDGRAATGSGGSPAAGWGGSPAAGRGGFDGLVEVLLGDDPSAIVAGLDAAWAQGAAPTELSLALCYAAALRVARFATSNEFGDWITVLHTLTYCNALHQSLKRSASPEVARGIYHGALKVYLDRFLNVPPVRLPDGRGRAGTLGGVELPERLLELLDRQAQVGPAAELVDGYLRDGGAPGPLWAALGAALLREDAEFHTYQMYEAGARLFSELEAERPEAARHVAVAVVRYLAAHAPTHREMRQTARIAIRLQRGDDLAAEEDES